MAAPKAPLDLWMPPNATETSSGNIVTVTPPLENAEGNLQLNIDKGLEVDPAQALSIKLSGTDNNSLTLGADGGLYVNAVASGLLATPPLYISADQIALSAGDGLLLSNGALIAKCDPTTTEINASGDIAVKISRAPNNSVIPAVDGLMVPSVTSVLSAVDPVYFDDKIIKFASGSGLNIRSGALVANCDNSTTEVVEPAGAIAVKLSKEAGNALTVATDGLYAPTSAAGITSVPPLMIDGSVLALSVGPGLAVQSGSLAANPDNQTLQTQAAGYLSVKLAPGKGLLSESAGIYCNTDNASTYVNAQNQIAVLLNASGNGLRYSPTGIECNVDTNSMDITSSNTLAVKVDTSSGLGSGTSGVYVNITSPLTFNSSTGALSIVALPDSGLNFSGGGMAILYDFNTIWTNEGENPISVHLAPQGGLSSSSNGVQVVVDNDTIKINSSGQLYVPTKNTALLTTSSPASSLYVTSSAASTPTSTGYPNLKRKPIHSSPSDNESPAKSSKKSPFK